MPTCNIMFLLMFNKYMRIYSALIFLWINTWCQTKTIARTGLVLGSDYLQYSGDLNIAPALQPMNNVTAIWLKATQSSYEPNSPATWTFLIQRLGLAWLVRRLETVYPGNKNWWEVWCRKKSVPSCTIWASNKASRWKGYLLWRRHQEVRTPLCTLNQRCEWKCQVQQACTRVWMARQFSNRPQTAGDLLQLPGTGLARPGPVYRGSVDEKLQETLQFSTRTRTRTGMWKTTEQKWRRIVWPRRPIIRPERPWTRKKVQEM